MSEQAKHTPTPWFYEPEGGMIFAGTKTDAIHVVDIRGYGAGLPMDLNAEFIVTACNSHDDLLEACKGLLNDSVVSGMGARIRDHSKYHGIPNPLDAARAAISKAGGGTS